MVRLCTKVQFLGPCRQGRYLIYSLQLIMNEYQVTLISDAPSNTSKLPSSFESRLAYPLNLAGTWGVSIMDITYPNKRSQLALDMSFAILFPSQNTPTTIEIRQIREQLVTLNDRPLIVSPVPEKAGEIQLYDDLEKIGRTEDFQLVEPMVQYNAALGTFPKGRQIEFDKMVSELDEKANQAYRLRYPTDVQKHSFLTFDTASESVEFRNHTTQNYLVVAPFGSSIIQMLGHSSKAQVIRCPSGRLIEVLVVEKSLLVKSGTLTKIKKQVPRMMENVFVYSDIVKSSLVGDSQANFLGYFPILSTTDERGYWGFNPPYYHEVQMSTIDRIAIKLCTEDGQLFTNEGKVIIRLHFRRIR